VSASGEKADNGHAEGGSKQASRLVSDRLTDLIAGLPETPFQLILDDPLGEAFIGPRPTSLLTTPEIAQDVLEDEQLHVEQYERTREMNEDVGLIPSDDYGRTAAIESLNNTLIPEVHLSVGDVCQARYLGEWLDCRVSPLLGSIVKYVP
jgi:hypothetical protein